MNKAEEAFKNSDMYKHGDFEDFYCLDHITQDNLFEFMEIKYSIPGRKKI
jgi:hypothetical protein